MERTAVIIKPDAVQRNLVGKIITMFEEKGFKLVGLKMLTLSQSVFEALYADIAGRSYYEQTNEFMRSGPCVAILIEGPDAIRKAMDLCGPSDLSIAEGWTVRGRFALWTGCDVIHRSDSIEQAAEATRLLFKENDIQKYQKVDECFMNESTWKQKVKRGENE